MKLAILGYGVEGKSVEAYFQNHPFIKDGEEFSIKKIEIFDNFSRDEIANFELDKFDLVFRSPSVPVVNLPENVTTATRYFFDHCPAKIIGITGTKGKGTTCSLTSAILKALSKTPLFEKAPKVHLVGNIGTPALDILDKIKPTDIVVYEMSSFQLWDLHKSPHVAGILRIEPDHLDVHADFADYIAAKSNIAKHQSTEDFCIFYENSRDSQKIAELSAGTKIPYPFTKVGEKPTSAHDKRIAELLESLNIPGDHNKENAEAALLISAAYLGMDFTEFIRANFEILKETFVNFKGLSHRLEFIRELNGVRYFDDNYSSAFPALDVALKSFSNSAIVLIAGGKDRGLDLNETKATIFGTKNLKKAILIGETKEILANRENPTKYILAETLSEAVNAAQELAEAYAEDGNNAVVVMSPGAASFDMFENFKDRGEKFTQLVKDLK